MAVGERAVAAARAAWQTGRAVAAARAAWQTGRDLAARQPVYGRCAAVTWPQAGW